MTTKNRHPWGRIIGITFLALAALVVLAGLTLRRKIPPEMMADVRAGIAARNIKDPAARLEKYLAERYGPQTDPANRQKVFLNMFNPEHIRAMHFMMQHSPEAQRRANMQAMAKWLENYRNSLKPVEWDALSAQLQGPEGQARLRQATAEYDRQDVYYRGMTAPVIGQLLTTIAQTRK